MSQTEESSPAPQTYIPPAPPHPLVSTISLELATIRSDPIRYDIAMAARPPPLLLTKRLTSFLHLNLSPQISTLLLLTPGGKLLAYASNPPIPVATLRTHGTVAASLYAIHSAGTDRETIDAALGGGRVVTAAAATSRNSGGKGKARGGTAAQHPLAVTIQLESGTVLVIRRLRCGMLFVCMGPPDGQQSSSQTSASASRAQQQSSQPSTTSSALTEVAAAAGGATNGHHHTPSTSPQPQQQPSSASAQYQPIQQPPPAAAAAAIGSPSEVASILSAATAQTTATTGSSALFGTGTAGVMATRRHAEELARWLDDKLGTLEIPSDGLGGVV